MNDRVLGALSESARRAIANVSNQVSKIQGTQIGSMNVTLQWFDGNDLDMHVWCPCGTKICYSNKNCSSCGGAHDVDMNAGGNVNSTDPVEHIRFGNMKNGTYKYQVNYYSQKNGGGQTSRYIISVTDVYGNALQAYESTVSAHSKQSPMYEFVYPPPAQL
jgi:uncharacterized protein YfaP (DUF2135 family)